MAIIELQIRTDRFCELVKGEINSQPLDRPTTDEPAEIAGKPLERIECTSCTFLEMTDDVLVLDAKLAFHYHDSLAEVKNAGSLTPATPSTLELRFRIHFSMVIVTTPAPRPVLSYDLLAYGIKSVKKDRFAIGLPADVPVSDARIRADDNVVAIRIATDPGDDVTAPVVDRLGGQEWMQHIPGALIADTIRGVLNQLGDTESAASPR